MPKIIISDKVVLFFFQQSTTFYISDSLVEKSIQEAEEEE